MQVVNHSFLVITTEEVNVFDLHFSILAGKFEDTELSHWSSIMMYESEINKFIF